MDPNDICTGWNNRSEYKGVGFLYLKFIAYSHEHVDQVPISS